MLCILIDIRFAFAIITIGFLPVRILKRQSRTWVLDFLTPVQSIVRLYYVSN